jgi:hypothetical protein
MPDADPVNWQPISQIPLIASMIDGALDDTRDHVVTLNNARDRPHVLDDATIDRVDRVHSEQLEYVDIYDQQISRWRTEKPSAGQTRIDNCGPRPWKSSPWPTSYAWAQSTASWE